MEPGEAPGIVPAPLGVVGSDVVLVPLAQPLDGLLNVPRGNGKDEGPSTCVPQEICPSGAGAGMDLRME